MNLMRQNRAQLSLKMITGILMVTFIGILAPSLTSAKVGGQDIGGGSECLATFMRSAYEVAQLLDTVGKKLKPQVTGDDFLRYVDASDVLETIEDLRFQSNPVDAYFDGSKIRVRCDRFLKDTPEGRNRVVAHEQFRKMNLEGTTEGNNYQISRQIFSMDAALPKIQTNDTNLSGIPGRNDPKFSYEIALENFEKTTAPKPDELLGRWLLIGSAKSLEALRHNAYGMYMADGRFKKPSRPGYFQSWLLFESITDALGNRSLTAKSFSTGFETGRVDGRLQTGPDTVQISTYAISQLPGDAKKCLTQVKCGILRETNQLLCTSTTTDPRQSCGSGKIQPYVVQLFTKAN